MMDSDSYVVHVLGAQVWDPTLDNVDVEVRFRDGRRFSATFFTLHNLKRLFDKNRATGECAGGLYMWAANMIVVEVLSMDVITRTIEDLIDSGEFDRAFCDLSHG